MGMPSRGTVVACVVLLALLGGYLYVTARPAPEGLGRQLARIGDVQAALAADEEVADDASDAAAGAVTGSGDAGVAASASGADGGAATRDGAVLVSPVSPADDVVISGGDAASAQLAADLQRLHTAATARFTTRYPGEAMGRTTVHDMLGRPVMLPVHPGGDVVQLAPGVVDSALLSTDPRTVTGLQADGTLALPAQVAVEWQRLVPAAKQQGNWDVAFSASQGPLHVIDGVPVGFARTPVGAAVAAWCMYQVIGAGGVTASRAVAMYVADSQVRERAISLVANPDAPQWPAGDNVGSALGFAVQEFTPDAATIAFAVGDQTHPRVFTVPVIFQDGDWHLQAPIKAKVAPLTPSELATFTRW
ncbi:hypothetical protein CCHOA_00960 [Corynebacterium choanae]|uniref:DUF8175 domain-containing protein n=1 Tax=Corynebacterium choanae TaxID=1862358 RepID=A0A3G6J847_9CORY|nr:hypothetical protein CCHOA_00960 [Corynebacterium choanae]